MTEILLVRHGQASLGGPSYDQLSSLGYQQAQWLADYLHGQHQQEPKTSMVMSGGMKRQQQTAEPILMLLGHTAAQEHAGFREFDFEQVVMAYLELNPGYPLADKPTHKELYRLLSAAMEAWAENGLTLQQDQESWPDFHQRVAQAWAELQPVPAGRSIIVTSAGVIASILRHLLRLDNLATIRLNLQIKNSSVTRLYFDGSDYHLSGFNSVSHLEHPERAHAITSA
ncbi:histidine phosphatase family protein [Simiduia curdlanivorans]|uniref:Histidine phosphatase family protein n=1 Tax=Simiduia curdlanivorans TaxID=1492769 RepID=A0ABV8UZF7_9GAMM|nr:histidine phosphatase family protein [Simiduia curdlanivorans]MDN3640449.1 histidine phosphatase family protein [Simiduia curdlanivorans]